MTEVQIRTCARCASPLPGGAGFCTRCGNPVAPASLVAAGVPGASGVLGHAPSGAPGRAPTLYAPTASPYEGIAAPGSLASRRGGKAGLGPAFQGLAPASTGRRLAAFTLDVLLCGAVGAGVFVLSSSPVLAGLAAAELAIGSIGWEVRRGTTIGQRTLGVWTTRKDVPVTAGVGRVAARTALTGSGLVVGGVGAWVVVGSSAWDSDKLGRGWQDKVSGTRTVMEPDRGAAKRRRNQAASRRRNSTTGADSTAPALGYLEPHVTMAPTAVLENSQPVPDAVAASTYGGTSGGAGSRVDRVGTQGTSQPSSASTAPVSAPASVPITQAVPVPPSLAAPLPDRPIAVPGEAAPVVVNPVPSFLVFEFDTGQRVRVATPGVGIIGRGPRVLPADSPESQLVTVSDPDSTVSKRHASFEVTGSTVWVTDLGSTNGTFIISDGVVGSQLSTGHRREVPLGGAVRIGDRTFSVTPAD